MSKKTEDKPVKQVITCARCSCAIEYPVNRVIKNGGDGFEMVWVCNDCKDEYIAKDKK